MNRIRKVALVTGAARRIGAAIAKALHQAGFNVVIHYHKSLKEAHDLALELNEQRAESAYIIGQDLCADDAAKNLIDETLAWSGRLDVLVNNASVFIKDSASMHETWDRLFNTNLRAPFILSHTAWPYLVKSEGLIINVTDIHAEKPLKGYSVYCQTKAALVTQTKALAVEFAPKVRVNAVAPGAIAWPENDNTLEVEIQQKIIAKTPLKRHGNADCIAHTVLSLVENPFVTGQIWAVDGGRSLG